MKTAEADANFTLDQLNDFLAQRETAWQGPLQKIGHDDTKVKTLLTIDDKDPNGAPEKAAKITIGAIPPGGQAIDAGQVYIGGTLTNAAAYRPA